MILWIECTVPSAGTPVALSAGTILNPTADIGSLTLANLLTVGKLQIMARYGNVGAVYVGPENVKNATPLPASGVTGVRLQAESGIPLGLGNDQRHVALADVFVNADNNNDGVTVIAEVI